MSDLLRKFVYAPLLLPSFALAQNIQAPDSSEFRIRSERSVTISTPPSVAEDSQTEVMPTTSNMQPLPWQTQNSTVALPISPSQNKVTADTALPTHEPDPISPPITLTPEPEPQSEPEEPPPTNTAVLQGLNKVTGHVSKLQGPIGTVLTFDNLEIIARRCWKAPADEQPENAALLEIREIKTGEEPLKLFMGWMFSSSQGLSGLEHPVYDISIVSCDFLENPEGIPEVKDEPKTEPKEKPKTKVTKAPAKSKLSKAKAVKSNP